MANPFSKMKNKSVASLVLAGILTVSSTYADPLSDNFKSPPAAARPWVYWFWNNGNVTSNGITADLEAMQRNGVGGVLIMDVLERFAPPRGSAEFMNAEWRGLFQFSVQESARLGLEINMANGPGWCGSSGPWITPEMSMQMLVRADTVVAGPTNFSAVLAKASSGAAKRGHDILDSAVKYEDYYRDIAVLAFPQTPNGVISRGTIVDLTAKLGPDGKLDWDVPAGNWIIARIGHTTTGSSTRPPVAGGNGLECDKLSAAAMDLHFANMMGRLITNAGPLVGKSLVATHIDSWEVGSQNWTAQLREEFQKRRGYDPLPWLLCLPDGVREKGSKQTPAKLPFTLDNPEATARFRWDYAQTISELLAENYSGRIAELAHGHGLRYSLEGYDLPFGDQFSYTARSDEPMTEFWTGSRFDANFNDTRTMQAASVGHIYDRTIIGAESFTSGDGERWKLTPADIKALGDYQFSRGINRLVVHRYAHQPYLDRAPGATMGPWGLHYERTQTWWEMSGAWHEYVARCQFMLRQGKFVADLLYLRPEEPNQKFFNPNPPPPAGYRYDEIGAEALMQRISVQAGKLDLPDGRSYRVLVLPPTKIMTPALAGKIQQLVAAGATVLVNGPHPQASPSLSGFPQCDEAVAKLTGDIWGNGNGSSPTTHSFGLGKVIWGQPLGEVLADLQAPPDFASSVPLNWIHRSTGDAEVYFIANPSKKAVSAEGCFRVREQSPEIWNPQTGEILSSAMFARKANGISLPVFLHQSDSLFVVFRRPIGGFDPVASITHDHQPVLAEVTPQKIVIRSANYGIPGDAARTRNVCPKLQALVDRGELAISVAQMAEGDDPAYGIVKTLQVDCTVDGVARTLIGKDTDTISFDEFHPGTAPVATVQRTANGSAELVAREAGIYEIKTASGKTLTENVSAAPASVPINGPWQLAFPPKWGAPTSVMLTNLISWTSLNEEGVMHFSGTAVYHTTFEMPKAAWQPKEVRHYLELGEVQVMARIKVNGHDCGVVWRPPFRVEVTSALRAGKNELTIEVANLWLNRMIGDAALPKEKRFTWSSWEPFKSDTPLVKSGLLGPVAISQTWTRKLSE